MKSSDILYGTDYAIGSPEYPWSWQRATVSAHPRSGLVYAKVGNSRPVECPTRKVIKPWAEHEAEQVQAARRERERRAGLERRANESNEAARWLAQHVDPETLPYFATRTDSVPHSDWSGITAGRGEITTIQIKQIVWSALKRVQRDADDRALRTAPFQTGA
jgi:hypothetical protein